MRNIQLLIYLLFSGIISCFAQELPIKPARTISFTTDEGSYMNIDVSPDGKTLAFDLLGDLYTVSAKGGRATQLTRGIALNLRPVWSSDGKMLAYLSDRSGDFHLNVRDIKGSFNNVLGRSDELLNWWGKRLDYGKEPVWTPESHYILLGDSVYGVGGGKLSGKEIPKHIIRFSGDGKLAYYLDSNLCSYDMAAYKSAVLSPSPDNNSQHIKHIMSTAISGDGHWWAYVYQRHDHYKMSLVLQDLQSGKKRTIVVSLFQRDSSYTAEIPAMHFCFSPNSKVIYIGYGGKIHRIEAASGKDEVIPFAATIKADLGTLNYNTFRLTQDSLKVKYARSASPSPDGKHLVFMALSKLYIMDLPNGKPHRLIDQNVGQFQPVWSPDGKWIGYVSWCDTTGGQLWKVPATGGRPEQITKDFGLYERPAWSPDGKFIAVVKGSNQLSNPYSGPNGQLEIVELSNGKVKIMADSIPLWNQLYFSVDGTNITYEPKEVNISGYSNVLASMDTDRKNKQVIATCFVSEGSLGPDRYRQRSISQDGRYLVFTLGEDLYLVPVSTLNKPFVMYNSVKDLSIIRFAHGIDPVWEQGGKVLGWTYGNKFYRTNPDNIILTAQQKYLQKQYLEQLEDKTLSGYLTPALTAYVKSYQVIDLKVSVPASYTKGTLMLKNVRIITMQGDKVIEHGSIVITNGHFTAVGPGNVIMVPKNARVIDLNGKTVMPGIIDLHSHSDAPEGVLEQQGWQYLADLAYGVTTDRDPASNFDSFGIGELLNSGQMVGPRMFTVGRSTQFKNGERIENFEDATTVASKRAELGAVVVKQYTRPTRLQREWLLKACEEQGLNMTNEGAHDPLLYLAMIKDGSTGVEHNPEWGDVYKDVITFVAKSKSLITPALQICYGEEPAMDYFDYVFWRKPDSKLLRFTPDYNLGIITGDHPKDTLKPGFLVPAKIDSEFHKAGAKLGLGSHGGHGGDVQGITAQNELWALKACGLTNMEALQSATIVGAEGLGMQKDIGSIEVGKIADLIIFNKNPLDDIHNSRDIKYVMRDGMLYDGDTLDELWPEKKKCPQWRNKNLKGEQSLTSKNGTITEDDDEK